MLLLYPSKKEAQKIKKRARFNQITQSVNAWIINNPGTKIYRSHDVNKEYERNKAWTKTPNGQISSRRTQSQRNRELGYECLNEYVEGFEGHHINSNQVVFIPSELHKAHPHNHKKPETMVEINRIAMQYLFNYKA